MSRAAALAADRAYRAALVARAKAVAVPVASCVAASLAPAHLTGSMTRDELAALVVVLAEAAEPGRLRAVVAAQDGDGIPSPGPQELTLRRAHREFNRCRRAREPVNAGLLRLERKYQAEAKRRQKERGNAA